MILKWAIHTTMAPWSFLWGLGGSSTIILKYEWFLLQFVRKNDTHKLPIFVPCFGTFWILIFKWAMCTILIHFHDGWVTHQAMLFCAQMVSLLVKKLVHISCPNLSLHGHFQLWFFMWAMCIDFLPLASLIHMFVGRPPCCIFVVKIFIKMRHIRLPMVNPWMGPHVLQVGYVLLSIHWGGALELLLGAHFLPIPHLSMYMCKKKMETS